MTKSWQAILRFIEGEEGPTAVEYATMLALIVVVCLAAVSSIGTNANKHFSKVSSVLGGTGS